MTYDFPHGFVLSDAALYSFKCQDVYPDIVAFAAAIPNHLRPLFLIPIQLETANHIAARVARKRYADSSPSGDTPEGDLFGTKTFVTYDNESGTTGTDPGSIFEIDGPHGRTHHQDVYRDENILSPDETTYLSEIDITQYTDYPYRSKEQVRHSSLRVPRVALVRIAIRPEALTNRVPGKVKDKAGSCEVKFISYDKRTRVYTFDVNSGNGAKRVQASLSGVDEVALSCNCPFWRYNGPEFHAKENSYLLGQPYGTAAPPDVRDPDRQFSLCKHSYAVLKRLEEFVQEVSSENWNVDDEQELLQEVDNEWDRLEGVAQVPLSELEEDDVDIDTEWEAATSEMPEDSDQGIDEQGQDEPEGVQEPGPPPEAEIQIQQGLDEVDYQVEEETIPELEEDEPEREVEDYSEQLPPEDTEQPEEDLFEDYSGEDEELEDQNK